MLTKEQLEELDKRWLAYKNDEGVNFSWDETKSIIINKIKAYSVDKPDVSESHSDNT